MAGEINWADFKPAPDQDVSNLVAAITHVESGGDAGAVSTQGATGSMQIMPATFRQYAQPGESYGNDADRRAAAVRKIVDDYIHFGGDVGKTAAAYIGGRGAVLSDGTIRDDVADANGTTPAAYAQAVVGRIGKRPKVDWSQFTPVPDAGGGRGFVNPPAADPSANLPQPAGTTYSPPDPDMNPEASSGGPELLAALQAQPDAGAGRGYVNPPAAVQGPREVGFFEGAARGAGQAAAEIPQIAALATSLAPIALDKLHSLFTGQEQTGAQDWFFRNSVDPAQRTVDWYALDPNERASFLGKIGQSVGSMAEDLPLMIISGGLGPQEQIAQQAPTIWRFLQETTSRGFDAMRPIMVKAATQKAKQVLDAGGTPQQAMTSATTAAIWTGVTGAQPMSAAGSLVKRVATGVPAGMVQEEAGRVVQNAADPEQLQQPFDAANMVASGVTNAAAAGALGHAEPTTRAEPARDPVADLFNAGTVEDAAAAAVRMAEPGAPDAPARGAPDTASEIRAIRPNQPVDLNEGAADVREPADIPAVPAGANRAGGADASAGLGAGVGPDRAVEPAVDAAGMERAPEAAAAPVGDGIGAGAVTPELQAARDTIAAVDAGGIPLNPAKLRVVAEGLGLEVSPNAKPEETIARIRAAVDRAEPAPEAGPGLQPEQELEPAFRRGQPPLKEGGDRLDDIQATVSNLTRDWLRKPDIHVLDSMNDAPEPVRRIWAQQNSQGAFGDIEGFHWKGGVYLVGDALHSEADVQRVLFHEALGHFGLRRVFGDRLNPMLDEVAGSMHPAMQEKAQQYGFDLADPSQRRQAAEEVLAEIAQTRPELGIVQRAVAAVRTFLREHGIDSLAMTRDEIIRNYILPARGFVERGDSPLPSFAEQPRREPQAMFSRKGATVATSGMPTTAPTSRWERAKAIVSDLIDEGLSRSGVYRLTSPMSEGSVRARAIAQNFANQERLARAQWQRISDLIGKRFTPDQRRQMWEAADEQNTLLQQGAPTAGRGLDRLTPGQRDVVEQLHTYGEELLRRAKNAGMFQGEGLPYWTPRMMVMIDGNGEYARPTEPGKKATSAGEGRNVFTTSGNLKQRKYLTAAETEAAMQAKGGELVRDIMTMPLAMQRLERAIAGRELINQIKDLGTATGTPTVTTGRPDHEGWFTLDHNAFTTFRPRFEQDPATGKMQPVLDSHGDIVFDRVPLYMSKEFEGPVKAILSGQDGPIYRGLMLLKSKAMSAIMFSPLIHNLVIFGRALGYDPSIAGTVGLYFKGHAAREDNELLRTAVEGGMVPMGYNRNGMIDITDVARGFGREGGWLDPQESWIAHGARAIIGSVNKDAGEAAKRFVDRAGDIWHGTLLWNRVADLQMGIFAHAYERLQDKGFSPEAAKVLAAHWANRYAGAVAKENMSEAARKAANVMLFSRSFNMGNIGTIKDMVYGLPSGLRAKVMYELGPQNASKVYTEARRKAWVGFVADTAFSIIALSAAQSAVDRLKKDKGWDEIFGGYVDRAQRMWAKIQQHPLNPASYSPWQLSPTYDNEPGKQDRVDMGEIPDQGGRHEYMRLPTGKVVEDLINWTTHFPSTFESKMSPLARAAWQVLSNDRGFGVPVYDPNGAAAQGALDVAKYLARAQTPWDTIVTAWDKLHGKSTAIENDKLVGNATGFSFSQGHPQGPAAGVAADVEQRVQAQKMLAMEDVKRLLKYGDEDAARQKLEDSGLSPREVSSIIKRIEQPAAQMTPGQRKKFMQHSNEQDQERMDRVTQ